jgi:hypothetical protein
VKTSEQRLLRTGALVADLSVIATALGGTVAAAMDVKVSALQFGIACVTFAVVALILNRRAIALAGWRRLDTVQRSTLFADLCQLPPFPTLICAPRGDEEAQAYARHLLALFREAGWAVQFRMADTDRTVDNADVLLGVRNPVDPPTGVAALSRTLQRVGIRTATGMSGWATPDGVDVVFISRRE